MKMKEERSIIGHKALLGILSIVGCILDIFLLIMTIVNTEEENFVSGLVYTYNSFWFMLLGLGY